MTVFAGIALKNHTRSYLEKFVKTIDGFPEVVECHRVSGNFDYLLKLVLVDIEDYEQFILTKLARYNRSKQRTKLCGAVSK